MADETTMGTNRGRNRQSGTPPAGDDRAEARRHAVIAQAIVTVDALKGHDVVSRLQFELESMGGLPWPSAARAEMAAAELVALKRQAIEALDNFDYAALRGLLDRTWARMRMLSSSLRLPNEPPPQLSEEAEKAVYAGARDSGWPAALAQSALEFARYSRRVGTDIIYWVASAGDGSNSGTGATYGTASGTQQTVRLERLVAFGQSAGLIPKDYDPRTGARR